MTTSSQGSQNRNLTIAINVNALKSLNVTFIDSSQSDS